MNKIIFFLLFSVTCSFASGQKIYWKSNLGKINSPIGGMKEMKKLVQKEFVYPVSAIVADLEGIVDIKYILKKSGVPKITQISGVNNEDLISETKKMFLKLRFRSSARRTETDEDIFQITFSKKAWVKLYNKRGYKEIDYPYTPIDSTQKLYKYQFLQDKPFPLFKKKENYNSFNQYIANKLEYPSDALKMGLKGQVVISFVIEQSGNVTNIEVLQPLAAGCTEEALRLIKNLKWHPAIENKKAVRTLMISSIGFGVASSTFKASFNQGN